MSQSQRVMRWRLIPEEFGHDIKDFSGEENKVADAISRLPTASKNQNEYCTDTQDLLSKPPTELEQLVLEEDGGFPINLSAVQQAQQKELNIKNF